MLFNHSSIKGWWRYRLPIADRQFASAVYKPIGNRQSPVERLTAKDAQHTLAGNPKT
jgi:hypothetical protein